MVKDGVYYGIGFAIGGLLVGLLVGWPWAIPLFLLGAFCVYFFRDPDREIPDGPVAVSPADGKVVAVKQETPDTTRVSIFLNIFDVHVNRSPIAGKVTNVNYHRGAFLVASKEEASLQNEMNTITVEDGSTRVIFKQIAGLIARRIVCTKKAGDVVQTGERVGLIKFGSRVDVIFGPEWQITAAAGQRVQAGASILAVKKE